MDDRDVGSRPVRDDLHPAVYWAMVGLGLWFVISGWVLFGTDAYVDYLEVVVTGLFAMAIMLPLTIYYTGWRNDPRRAQEHAEPFRTWAHSDMQTWQSQLHASEASVLTLLPIAAVAFGLTAIGIVYHLAG
jgi:hypothetical protein